VKLKMIGIFSVRWKERGDEAKVSFIIVLSYVQAVSCNIT